MKQPANCTGGGAEANEGAIKLACKFGHLHHGGAHEIVTFGTAFHGRTLATMSACGKAGVIEAGTTFVQDLRALCDEHGVLLMFDEVQTAIGHTGTHRGWQASGEQFLEG